MILVTDSYINCINEIQDKFVQGQHAEVVQKFTNLRNNSIAQKLLTGSAILCVGYISTTVANPGLADAITIFSPTTMASTLFYLNYRLHKCAKIILDEAAQYSQLQTQEQRNERKLNHMDWQEKLAYEVTGSIFLQDKITDWKKISSITDKIIFAAEICTEVGHFGLQASALIANQILMRVSRLFPGRVLFQEG